MVNARVVFLLLTCALVAILGAIVFVTYSKKRKEKLEEPKHRMLEDD